MKSPANSRFDTRLPKEQKDFFEYAANLGGYRNLTEFVIDSADKLAREIVEKHQAILASEKDCAVFFKALTSPPKPNAKLRKAAAKHDAALKK